jgi:hypothetical protein
MVLQDTLVPFFSSSLQPIQLKAVNEQSCEALAIAAFSRIIYSSSTTPPIETTPEQDSFENVEDTSSISLTEMSLQIRIFDEQHLFRRRVEKNLV